MTRLHPEEEIKYAHFHMNLAWIAVCAICFAVGVPIPWDENYSNRTLWIIENYSIHENGTKFYNYSNPERGEFEYELMGKWYDHLINGEYRYDFGTSFLNFCWNREIPPRESLFSIFRASQLMAIVQVLLRSAVLITMTQQLLQLYVTVKHRSMIAYPDRVSSITSFIFINESVYYLSLFFIMNFQIWQDAEYIYMLSISATMAMVTFPLKLLSNSILNGYQLISLIRILCGIIGIALSGNLFKGMNRFLQYVNCDQYGVHMVEFFATDYLANSLLYHAYKQHLLDVVVGPESSPQLKILSKTAHMLLLKDLLITSCSAGFCIGEFLGTLSEQYPDREVEVAFSARKSPLIVFVENRARFRMHGKMDMFVRPANETQVKEMIIRADTTVTANIVMWISNTQIIGNATIENLDFKLLETKIDDVDQSSFKDLGLFGAEFLEKLLTEILLLGINMPTMQGILLKNPKLSFHERYLKVETYFKIDERYTGVIVRSAVKQTLNHIG
uniref:BPI2 domain-containing protein n=1 Tax=Heterorhabditis bacteriophora TaxID=37862 RepID=A0A1I7XUD8_HETBA